MFWVYIVLLVIAALFSLGYAIYHLTRGVKGWIKDTKQGGHRPKEWIVLTHKAYECGTRGEYQKSIEFAEKAIQLNPRASEAYRLIGNAYEFLGDEAEESGDYKKATEFHRKATEAWNKAKEINPHIIIPGYHE